MIDMVRSKWDRDKELDEEESKEEYDDEINKV